MIVVVGSRHDPVATDLVGRWAGAALCSAEDLISPGWVWPSIPGPRQCTWVVGGAAVADAEVSGVFVRRASVYADELTGTHPDDRAYLAAEAHAFLVHVLHRTGATVVNPVDGGGAFGEAALRPEQWMSLAASLGLPVTPLRVRSDRRPRPPDATQMIEVVGGAVVGASPTYVAEAAVAVCNAVGLRWAVVAFDRSERLVAVTTIRRPSDHAADHLAAMLGPSRAA